MRKNFINIFFITLFICAFGTNSNLFAQEENNGNIFVVTTFEMAFKPGNTMAEFDSLNKLYTEKVISKNNLIVSQRTLRHFWGHNNRDFVVITEVKNWGDIIEANKLSNELFEKAWPNEEARKEYNDANNKYFTGKHSDEIYQENAGGRVR
jgi:hypothetical protein